MFILGTRYLYLRVLRLHTGEVCCKLTHHHHHQQQQQHSSAKLLSWCAVYLRYLVPLPWCIKVAYGVRYAVSELVNWENLIWWRTDAKWKIVFSKHINSRFGFLSEFPICLREVAKRDLEGQSRTISRLDIVRFPNDWVLVVTSVAKPRSTRRKFPEIILWSNETRKWCVLWVRMSQKDAQSRRTVHMDKTSVFWVFSLFSVFLIF